MNHSDFISSARDLAASVISIADRMGAMASILQYSDITTTLAPEDFVGENAHITPEQIFAFLTVLGAVIGGMSADDKSKVYAVTR